MGPRTSCLLKGIARWDSKLIKGDRQEGSRISIFIQRGRQRGPHILHFLGNRQMGFQIFRPKRIVVKKDFQIDQVSTRSVSGVQIRLSL